MKYRLLKHSLCLAFVFTADGALTAELKSTTIPRYDIAVQKAVAYLQQLGGINDRDKGIVAYALLKAGVAKTDPQVAGGIALAKHRALADDAYTHYVGTYVASVDAMLLADVDDGEYRPEVQRIADRILSIQEKNGSWSNIPGNPGDVSLTQYSVLALWAAQRVGCTVDSAAFDRVASYLTRNSNSDGGWGYRPGTNIGEGKGQSTHNMTAAAIGTLSICRLVLFQENVASKPPKKKFGVLEQLDGAYIPIDGAYIPIVSKGLLDKAIERGVAWNQVRFHPIPPADCVFPLYYYYTLERAGTLTGLQDGWYTAYGDGLLTLQKADGHFDSRVDVGSAVATSLAVLYYMRSTQQIMDLIGLGVQVADRGSPFGEKKKKEPTELDRLIADISQMDIPEIDESSGEVADEIVRSVLAVDDPETLVGQADKLKSLMKHPNANVRSAAVWALGRTGNFKLVPLMLDGIRDNSVDVNIEAIQALRFIARKPLGFGETLAPFESLGTEAQIANASPEERLRLATPWREKALKDWSNWYFGVRPFEEQGGFDELQLAVPLQR